MPSLTNGEAGEVLLERARGRGKILRLALREYRGHRFLDLREWVESSEGLRATPKGCTVPLDAVGALHEALGAYLATNGAGGRSGAS